MDHAVNEAPVSHEMSTESRGSILPQGGRAGLVGPYGEIAGLEARNAFPLPATMYDDAEGDPCNSLTEGRA